MTVKQMINKLKKVPENAIVTMCNDSMFVNGEYIVTDIRFWESDNSVEIKMDYRKRIEGTAEWMTRIRDEGGEGNDKARLAADSTPEQ